MDFKVDPEFLNSLDEKGKEALKRTLEQHSRFERKNFDKEMEASLANAKAG